MIRDAYLETAAVAAALLHAPELAARWAEPSALDGFTVGGLAQHLAVQITAVPAILQGPEAQDTIPLLDYYRQSPWISSGVDSEANTGIRDQSEQRAADNTAPGLAAQADAAVEAARGAVAATAADRTVLLRGRGLSADDYLTTRTLELVVHCDDLAVSLGVPTPAPPSAATDTVIALLARIALWRHGSTAVLRTLSRQERAPATIAAL